MPVISVIVMPFGLIAVLLMPFGLDSVPFAIMGKGIDWMIALADWVAGWQGEIVTGRLPMAAFLLIGLGGGLLCLLRTRLRHVGTLLVGLGLLAAFWPSDQAAPEVLVSEDGRLVAVLRDGEVMTNRTRPPGFIYDQWRRALKLGALVKPVQRRTGGLLLEEEREKSANEGRVKTQRTRRKADREKAKTAMLAALAAALRDSRFVCEAKAFCATVSPSGWKIVTLEDVAFLGTGCDAADLVVVPFALRLNACRSGAKLVTARHLRRTGALEITPEDKGIATPLSAARIVQAVETLNRPWSRHRTYDWRTGRFDDAENNQL